MTRGGAAAVAVAAQGAQSSWAALAAAEPGLAIPSDTSRLGPARLQALAVAGQAAAARERAARAAVVAADRVWVREIDTLLRQSAAGREEPKALVDDVESAQVKAGAAIRRVDAIVAQRRALRKAIAAQAPPPHFRAVTPLLRQSIGSSLADALATQRFIDAWYRSDSKAYNHYFGQHYDAMNRTHAERAAFLERYNALRARFLHLKPIAVDY